MPQPLRLALLALLTAALTGCAARPVNPAFSVSSCDAKKAIDTIQQAPTPLDRPVIACAGWADPGFASGHVTRQLRKAFANADDQTLAVNFVGRYRFDTCRDKLIAAVDAAFPSDDPIWTTEVDVVAFSMGGLVARHAAAPPRADAHPTPTSKRRLKIRRLLTISTPHRGATLARLPAFEPRILSMRAGSPLLEHLDAAWPTRGYDFTAYTRLKDPIVGSSNTAPLGITPYWVAPPPFARSHQEAYRDPRIVADILRRLRGETPLTAPHPAPLPQ